MAASFARQSAAIAVLLSAAYLCSVCRTVSAQDKGPILRTGDFDGLWHGRKIKFSIQEVYEHGKLADGVAQITEKPDLGLKFGVHFRLGRDNSLVVTRYVAGDTQVSRCGPPKVIEGHYVWEGVTRGYGQPEDIKPPFKLTMSRR